jgi:hypothetical protein
MDIRGIDEKESLLHFFMRIEFTIITLKCFMTNEGEEEIT